MTQANGLELKYETKFCKKINISTNNFQQFTQYIYNIYIFNIYDENTTLKITKYLAKHVINVINKL